MINDIFEQKITTILKKGKCPKIVLFDSESLQIFSNLIPHSKFVENDFFLFELITNKSRERISKVTCFVILRPINYHLLCNELKNPFYNEYIILFTNYIDENVLKVIAEWDVSSVVTEIYEVYIDLFKQEDLLFTVNINNKPFKHESINDLRRSCDGLISLFRTINFIPTICCQSNSEISKMIGIEVSSRLSELKMKEGCKLVVIDRKFDLITPLVHNWHLLSMIDEYLKLDNEIVTVDEKSYDLKNNEVYRNLKFVDINSASDSIKKFVGNIESNKISKDAYETIEEKSKNTEKAEALLAIQNKILSECVRNKELSELEYRIIRKNDVNIEDVVDFIKCKNIEMGKQLKLIIIFLIVNGFKFGKINLTKSRLFEKVINEFPVFRAYLEKFAFTYFRSEIQNQEIHAKNKEIIYRFNNEVDIKLGYIPQIKNLVNDIYKKNLNPKEFSVIRQGIDKTNTIVIYFSGGVTLSEYKSIVEYIEKYRSNRIFLKIYLVSDCILNHRKLISNIIDP